AAELLPPPQVNLTSPPVENPVWNGWDVFVIAGLTLTTLFFVQILIAMGARRFVFPHASWLEVAQKPALALLSQLLAYVVVGLYMILLVGGKYHLQFWTAIRWNWPRSAWPWLGSGVMLFFGLSLLGHLLPMP